MDLLNQVRSERLPIGVIVLTAYGDPAECFEAMKAGADDFVAEALRARSSALSGQAYPRAAARYSTSSNSFARRCAAAITFTRWSPRAPGCARCST